MAINNSNNINYNKSNNGNNTMRTLGIIMIVIGLGIALYTGFNSVTNDQVVNVRNVELRDNNRDNRDNNANWGPFAGIGLMIIGGIVYFAGRKKVLTHDRNSDNPNRTNLDNPNRNSENRNIHS